MIPNLSRTWKTKKRKTSSLFFTLWGGGFVDAPKWNFIARAKSCSAPCPIKKIIRTRGSRFSLWLMSHLMPCSGSSGCSSWVLKLCAILCLLGILLAPIICLVAAIPGGLGFQSLLAIAVGVPLICIIILVWPVSVYDPDPYQNVGYTQFTVNGNTFNHENYFSKLVDFHVCCWFEDMASGLCTVVSSIYDHR